MHEHISITLKLFLDFFFLAVLCHYFPFESFHYLSEAYKKDGDRFFTRTCRYETKGIGVKLKES